MGSQNVKNEYETKKTVKIRYCTDCGKQFELAAIYDKDGPVCVCGHRDWCEKENRVSPLVARFLTMSGMSTHDVIALVLFCMAVLSFLAVLKFKIIGG